MTQLRSGLADRPRRETAFIGLLVVGLVLLFRFADRLAITGDEPRYLLYAYSFFKHGSFFLTDEEWRALSIRATGSVSAYPWIGNHEIGHPVYLSSLLSPLAFFLSLRGLRAAAFIAGALGLWTLLRLCRGAGRMRFGSAALAVAVAAGTIPLLPYLHLFYMEAFLFSLVATAWQRIHAAKTHLSSDVVTALLILAIPFVHLRGSVVAVGLFVVFAVKIAQRGNMKMQMPRLAGMAGLAFGAACLLASANLLIYGSLTGSVTTARPPPPSQTFWVVAMQWFNLRHGLIAFAPVWLLGYTGLVVGALHGRRLAVEGLGLALIAMFTGIGPNPGECWPARFWVLSIPMLAVGLGCWLEHARSIAHRLATLILLAISYANTALFIVNPNLFLENRQASVTYDAIFHAAGTFHLGLNLPAELSDRASVDIARNFMIAALVLITLLVVSVHRRLWGWASVIVIVAYLDLSRVKVLPQSAYDVVAGTQGVALRLKAPIEPALFVSLGEGRQTWFVAPQWPRFRIDATAATGESARWWIDAGPIVAVACRDGIQAVDVNVSAPPDFSHVLAGRPIVYQSYSALRNASSLGLSGCVP